MKISIVIISVLLAISLGLNVFFILNVLNVFVKSDHTQASVKTYMEREVALARMSKAFIGQMDEMNFRKWISKNAHDLSVSDQGDQLIINGVEVRFKSGHSYLEFPQGDDDVN